MLKYKNIHCARQRKYDIRKLKDMEFMGIYEEQVSRGITANSNKITGMSKQLKLSGRIINEMVTITDSEVIGYT